MKVLLALGTNLGDRLQNLKKAISKFTFIEEMICSSIYESEALLPKDAPGIWNKPFLNMVVLGKCLLAPKNILDQVKAIEKELGRDINSQRWSPRIIDIDILLVDDLICNYKDLQIPHPEFLKRNFVVIPAQEIAFNMTHPILNTELKNIKCDTLNLRLTNYKV